MNHFEEDDKPKRHTLHSLFHVYCNHVVVALDVDNEVHDSILLSQIDAWLDQAKLLRSVFSLTETGLTYMKFRKWRLDFDEFQDFLEILCIGKEITPEEVKLQLLEAGLPGGSADVVVVK